MIPPKLHFIWINGEFKDCYRHAIRSAQQNTKFEIYLHTNVPGIDISGVIVKHRDPPNVKVAYTSHLCDIMRCEILYEEGGIYSDLDAIWLRNPWEFMDKKVVIGYSNQSYKILCGAVMMAEKGHPAMKKYLDWLLSIMPCKTYWATANPYKIWKDDPEVTMIKKKYFFPVNYKHIPEATLEDFEDSIAAHLFASMHDLDAHYRRIFGTIFEEPIKIDSANPP